MSNSHSFTNDDNPLMPSGLCDLSVGELQAADGLSDSESSVRSSLSSQTSYTTSSNLTASTQAPVAPVAINAHGPPARPIYDERVAHRLSYADWLVYKRETYERKRFILSDSDYNDLLSVIRNRRIVNQQPDLKWAATFIAANGIQLIVQNNPDGQREILVKPKGEMEVILPNSPVYRIVVKLSDIEAIIQSEHETGSHCGVSATYKRITQKYCCLSRDLVLEYLKRCTICKDVRSIPKKASRKPLQPIISKGTFHHILIDLIDYSKSPVERDGKKYMFIAHAIDHYSTFRVAEPLEHKAAKDVYDFVRRLFSIIGYPVIFQSDNGGEFKNGLLESYLAENHVEFRHSKPYTPTTQGKIERANQSLKQAINKNIRISKTSTNWVEVLYSAVYSINTNVACSTGTSPYELVFFQAPPQRLYLDKDQDNEESVLDLTIDTSTEKSCDEIPSVVPIPAAVQQSLASNSSVLSVENDRVNIAINELRTVVDGAVHKSRYFMKKHFDKRFKAVRYNIGDIVGVMIPSDAEYYVKQLSNKVPAAVIGYEEVDDFIYYILGYKYQIIKGRFTVGSLLPLHPRNYALHIGIAETDINNPSIYANWGLNQDAKEDEERYYFITLHDAYIDYITSQATLSGRQFLQDPTVTKSVSSETDDDDSAISHEIPIIPPLKRKKANGIQVVNINASSSSSNPKEILPKPFVGICKVCEKSTEEAQNTLICNRCNSIMHHPSLCKYGTSYYYDQSSEKYFCNYTCFKEVDIYEVEIVGENSKHYRVRCNDGEIRLKAKSVMNKLAEYYKLVTVYKQKKTEQAKANSVEIDESSSSSVHAPNSESHSIPTIQFIGTNSNIEGNPSHPVIAPPSQKKCCVCKQALTAGQWKTCHSCGREMHGKIICKRGRQIVDDDGVMYCSKKCKKN